MHRLAATPGGWNPNTEGVIFIEQTPAPIVFLSAADTDIQVLALASTLLPEGISVRAVNLLQLQQQLSIDTYAEEVLSRAKAIVLRLLGGRSYWSYGLEVVRETARDTGAKLIVLPGDDAPDPDLIGHSTVPLQAVNQLWRYFTEGGIDNIVSALQFVADLCLGTNYNPPKAIEVPRVGLYAWNRDAWNRDACNRDAWNQDSVSPLMPKAGILFYRAHYLAGNTAPIDALCQALALRQLDPVPVFVSSLRDRSLQTELLSYFQDIQLILNTTGFAIGQVAKGQQAGGQQAGGQQAGGRQAGAQQAQKYRSEGASFWQKLDVPALQVILSGGTRAEWEAGFRGLSPRDLAMNVALPEVDGRIITRAISFKTQKTQSVSLETPVVVYEPASDRVNFVADLAANWIKLRKTPPEKRRIALILANYPNRDGRLANGVGLDTPASCVEILKALQQAGYLVEDIPASGDELIARLVAGVTNDPEGWELRPIRQQLSLEEYQAYFATLPESVKQELNKRWNFAGIENEDIEQSNHSELRLRAEALAENLAQDSTVTKNLAENLAEYSCVTKESLKAAIRLGSGGSGENFPISGLQLGNVFIGIQPARGYDLDPTLNYHAPDLEPTHNYLAFYYWLRQQFGAQAIVHVGKHGNLEWLPGKGVALSDCCYPEVALGPLPHLYPFIVNDPGEGTSAKRRAQATIIDHLTPPMTRAELYGPLQQLEALVDEYYEAQSLDPTRLPVIQERIATLILAENLHQDLGIEPEKIQGSGFRAPNLLNFIDGYLCELKEAQIRDGLHILGKCPEGRQLRDSIVAIARNPGEGRIGLTRAIAEDFNLNFDPITANPAEPLSNLSLPNEAQFISSPSQGKSKASLLLGDLISYLEERGSELVEKLIDTESHPDKGNLNELLAEKLLAEKLSSRNLLPKIGTATQTELDWIRQFLLPALRQTQGEIEQLLRGLDGRYVNSGPAGAPTRGRPDVLPTGRNFYSVDIRAIPTETAWDIGRKAAEELVLRYTQENGEYPKTLALSVWGTSTMRTGGDDIAEALALLGVRPVWDGPSRRVVDFEIMPVRFLGRPRVDVTLRISGFFRDGFPNLIDLFDRAVTAVAGLEESEAENPLAAQVRYETELWQEAGLTWERAEERSRYRIFGSKPGAYGAGLQGLIEAQNWTDDGDLARAYINWSSYAYGRGFSSQSRDSSHSPFPAGEGRSAPEAFEQRLRNLQIVLHNQDNREHDLLDSDDYYQFQGGLTVAARALTGKNPQTYFGDNSIPEKPKVRQLREEIARVYRSRVVNPKWVAGVMRHGYKGAFEMAATVDYLFAYDATARCVEDYMYEGVAKAYIFEPAVRNFIQSKNPWALRDMAERLLEASQRGLWRGSPEIIEGLRNVVLEAEYIIEDA